MKSSNQFRPYLILISKYKLYHISQKVGIALYDLGCGCTKQKESAKLVTDGSVFMYNVLALCWFSEKKLNVILSNFL